VELVPVLCLRFEFERLIFVGFWFAERVRGRAFKFVISNHVMFTFAVEFYECTFSVQWHPH
jgi:hypothetical protein